MRPMASFSASPARRSASRRAAATASSSTRTSCGAPGAMFTLGTQKQGHENYLLHHPKFDLDERALPVGTAILVETVKRFF